MKLPFRQLPELLPGHGLVVCAPPGGGRTFFLSRLAQAGLDQGLRVCYVGIQDGNIWLYELVQNKSSNLTFVDLAGALIDAPTLGKLLDAGLGAELLVVDDFNFIAYAADSATFGFAALTLKNLFITAGKQNTRLILGVALNRNTKPEPAPAPGPDHDALTESTYLRVTPVLYTPAQAVTGLKQFDNLKTIHLVKERT